MPDSALDVAGRVVPPHNPRPCPGPSSRCPALIIADNRRRALPNRRATPSASSTAFAVATPMPGTEVISSTLACFSLATEPKWVTSALRRCSPSPGTESSADAVIRLDRLLRW